MASLILQKLTFLLQISHSDFLAATLFLTIIDIISVVYQNPESNSRVGLHFSIWLIIQFSITLHPIIINEPLKIRKFYFKLNEHLKINSRCVISI